MDDCIGIENNKNNNSRRVGSHVGVGGGCCSNRTKTNNNPVRDVDPFVRALNTLIYGIVVHFWTMSMIPDKNEDGDDGNGVGDHVCPSLVEAMDEEQQQQQYPLSQSSCMMWLLSGLTLHEYWIYLQHSNVLGNPLCQRLDRQYGIALLKSNRHWAIAGTLSAYWCRESLSMFLCLPFLALLNSKEGSTTSTLTSSSNSTTIQYLILYSLIYHAIKSRGVRKDATQRFSSIQFGIMSIVIDKFYLHSFSETIRSLVRIFLQGFDTYIHFKIVSGMMMVISVFSVEGSILTSRDLMHILFLVWVIHAALNQYARMSTASIMVHIWHRMTMTTTKAKQQQQQQQPELADISDEDTDSSDASKNEDDDDDEIDIDGEFVVRDLLRNGRVKEELKGRKGAASSGVDLAIQLETIFAILSTLYIIGLNKPPIEILTASPRRAVVLDTTDIINRETLMYAWFLWKVLNAASTMLFIPTKKGRKSCAALGTTTKQSYMRWTAAMNLLDVSSMMIFGFHKNIPNHVTNQTTTAMIIMAVGILTKAFVQASPVKRPKIFWLSTIILESIVRIHSLRNLQGTIFVDAMVCAFWTLTLLLRGTTTLVVKDDDDEEKSARAVADVVFYGHPAELHDFWALALLPYSLEERWKKPWWATLLWPINYMIGYYLVKYRRKFKGDGGSFFNCDEVSHDDDVVIQTWTAGHFGRHFVTHKREVKQNIEAAARYANNAGVKVFCLGALNKAESINGGGVGLIRALPADDRQMAVIHGNHLTAAAVVETTKQVLGSGNDTKVFLTGASSKVGWAVARALRDRLGYQVLCHSTSEKRRKIFEDNGFEAASKLSEGMAYSKLWIVGKNDPAVEKYIPQDGTAIVFSVPHPFQKRKDVRVVEAGTLYMDLSRLDRPRRFTNKLKSHEIFACHAAGIIAGHRMKKNPTKLIDEVGPINLDEMDGWLDDAKDLGFMVPYAKSNKSIGIKEDDSVEKVDQVVIIGAGPSGLAVAASLQRKGIRHVVLEQQANNDAFGSWDHHFSGLQITTQKRWCNLPGFAWDDEDYPGEFLSGEDYRRYLLQYTQRFGIRVLRGITVDNIRRETTTGRWVVECSNKRTFEGSCVVVATGKNRIPRRDTQDGLKAKLTEAGIRVLHSSDVRGRSEWERLSVSARLGRLCVVGFGNSSADICAAVLRNGCGDATVTAMAAKKIHVAVRTVPPVFPRRLGPLRVESVGVLTRRLPDFVQEVLLRSLWRFLPSSILCDGAFPAHLPRWSCVGGRVPVIDKNDLLKESFESGALIGHGPVKIVRDDGRLVFDDGMAPRKSPLQNGDGSGSSSSSSCDSSTVSVEIDTVVLATGYERDVHGLLADGDGDREDRLNGLYMCGFGNERLLPLLSIGVDAEQIARDIETDFFRYAPSRHCCGRS